MVCEWGMAEELGPVTYGQEEEPIFLGKEIARHKDYSEDTARRIDNAIKEILDSARSRAEEILNTHKEKLEKLAGVLLEKETLVDEEIRSLLDFPPRADTASLTGVSGV
jgi:cell division protease FtsH